MGETNSCTLEDLKKILEETESEVLVLPLNIKEFVTGSKTRNLTSEQIMQVRDFRIARAKVPQSQEIYPKIFIGEESSAKVIDHLKKNSITHIANVACGKEVGEVFTSEDMYKPHGIKFLGVHIVDNSDGNFKDHLKPIFEFMDDALNSGNAVMVHCVLGISRSPSVIIAYLMDRKGMSAVEAMQMVCKKRAILPNEGFLRQLVQLDGELRASRSSS